MSVVDNDASAFNGEAGQDNRGYVNSDETTGVEGGGGPKRKITLEALVTGRQKRRKDCLQGLRESAVEIAQSGNFSHIETLLLDPRFSECLFGLFDIDAKGEISQAEWLQSLRTNIKLYGFDHLSGDFTNLFMDLLSSVTYLVCGEDAMGLDNFRKVMASRNVPKQLFLLADKDKNGELDVDEIMQFLVFLTSPMDNEDFSVDQVSKMRQIFRESLPPDKTSLTLDEFKKIMPNKNEFFVQRAFHVFDKDGDGTISLAEFLDTMSEFSKQGHMEKIMFLFKIYDIDGNGTLQLNELEDVMRACMKESGMKLPESDVQELAFALLEDATGEMTPEGEMVVSEEINIDQFKQVLSKHEGLLENLTISLASWLVPKKKPPKKKSALSLAQLKTSFNDKKQKILKEKQKYTYLFLFFAIANILFITRAVYFKNFKWLNYEKYGAPNPFYLLSRACGRSLNFSATMVLVLMLRYTLTKLRNVGLSAILPLDHHVYLHKLTGVVILVYAWVHTLMHLINFGVNVQPDPVRFVQLNSDYFPDIHYITPQGCNITSDAVLCEGRLNATLNITKCQVCSEEGRGPWTYAEWIFTSNPGVFGLVNGWAAPTGVGLILVLTFMVICSMPFVRMKGFFQLFYISHLICFVLFMVLLILHCPDFWKWICVPLGIYILEVVGKNFKMYIQTANSSVIKQGNVLPSTVTQLVIKKPYHFKHNPGDWVFIKIPQIANFEWHPFTISSAPENKEYFTLHIRGVGNWTKKLYNYYENIKTAEVTYKKRMSMQVKGKKANKVRRLSLQAFTKKTQDDVAVDMGYDGNEMAKKPKKMELKIFIDGPYGAPASDIFRAEHAVLIATGIGVTPFSSILQSIMCRYKQVKRQCPRCDLKWNEDLAATDAVHHLKKVDFFWINRDQKSFEWFLTLLNQMETEQAQEELTVSEGKGKRFMDIHMYFTQALQKTDMRAVGLQVALDLLYKKDNKDRMTGLKAKTNAGRPNWTKVFQQLRDQNRGKVTVFYCGNPGLASILRKKCDDFGFEFKKEVF